MSILCVRNFGCCLRQLLEIIDWMMIFGDIYHQIAWFARNEANSMNCHIFGAFAEM